MNFLSVYITLIIVHKPIPLFYIYIYTQFICIFFFLLLFFAFLIISCTRKATTDGKELEIRCLSFI